MSTFCPRGDAYFCPLRVSHAQWRSLHSMCSMDGSKATHSGESWQTLPQPSDVIWRACTLEMKGEWHFTCGLQNITVGTYNQRERKHLTNPKRHPAEHLTGTPSNCQSSQTENLRHWHGQVVPKDMWRHCNVVCMLSGILEQKGKNEGNLTLFNNG